MPPTPRHPSAPQAQPLAQAQSACSPATPAVGPSAAPGTDEREFEAFAQDQDPLDIMAATWVTRKRSGLSPEGEAELQAWLDADPRHPPAFEDMGTTFGDLQQLPDDDVTQLRAGLPERDALAQAVPLPGAPPATQPSCKPMPANTAWHAVIASMQGLLRPLLPQATTAAVVVAMAGGWMGWSLWQRQPVFEKAYATERGQQLQATLPDADALANAQGSTLQLDTATQAQVRLYRDRREVHLNTGQAMFVVHSDPQRPFHVYAGALRITVVGTRFSVRRTDTGVGAGQTVVAVEEGHVRVENDVAQRQAATPQHPPVAPVELTAGQTVAADAQGHIGPVSTLAPQAIATWRQGRLSFNQTPLAQAIAEFERYGRTGLLVRDPVVAALPVGGSYSLQQWQRFAETLPLVLPVRLVRQGEATEVVAQ